MVDIENLIISTHAKERYAERIMSREDKCTVQMFIGDHEDKIKQDITKMIEYGEVLYSGKSMKDRNKNCTVYRCDLWILIVDSDTSVVITLFKVDLGVGDKFNNTYVKNVLTKIESKKEEFNKYKEKENKTINDARLEMDDNKDKIEDLRRQIKRLEETNLFLLEVIKESNAKIDDKDREVRELVQLLTANKIF